jgi:hypothetical protein
MRHHSLPIALACGLLAVATPALATSSQTWVSASGANSGACPITAPCKTFAYAYTQTSANGVINVLSSGNYGPLTIAKSLSIVADGSVAAIYSAAGGAAININNAGAEVTLRGLTIDMFNSATNLGISVTKVKALHVHGTNIRGAGVGIRFAPSSAGAAELYVDDSIVTRAVGDGIQVVPSGGGSAKAVFDRVRVENAGGDGVAFIGSNGAINGTVRNSIASGNAASGITATAGVGAPVNVMLAGAAAINNGNTGIVATGAQIRMGDTTVSGNNLGLFASSGGNILTYGNNQVNANFNGGDGATTGAVAFK